MTNAEGGSVGVGDRFVSARTFTQAEFDTFATLSGDDNPIHVDAEFAAGTRFGRPVAHGMLLYSALCGFLNRHFPGAVQIEHDFMFTVPTFAGEEMMLQAEVMDVMAAENRMRLKTTITNPRGEITCDGETTLEWDSQ